MANQLTMLPAVFFLSFALVDGSTVKFQATPDSLEPLVTKSLTLICSLEDAPTNTNGKRDFKFVSSILISVDGEDIATIDAHSPATKVGNTTGVVSGRFTGKGLDGRLQITWEYPEDDQAGHYVCLVDGKSKKNRHVTVTKEIDIVKKNIDIQQMIEHMKALQETSDKQIKQISLMDAKIQTLQTQTKQQGTTIQSLQSTIHSLQTENTHQDDVINQLRSDSAHNDSSIMAAVEKVGHVETGVVDCRLGTNEGRTVRQTFSKPYPSTPRVTAAVSSFSIYDSADNDDNKAVYIDVQSVTTTGFSVRCRTTNYYVNPLKVTWISFPN